MDNETLVRNRQAAIVDDCESMLGRRLSADETVFITSRGALVALEAIHEQVRGLVGRPEELQGYLRSEAPTDLEVARDYTRYRLAWVAILRRQSVAKALGYVVLAVVLLSLLGLVSRPPTRFLVLALALLSLATHIAIRCPRCRAWWPLGSDDDGQRKPCARCGLRWGQEDELPEA